MRCVAIVQARMGSVRFPGKMAARLGERTLLEWVLLRTQRARRLDEVMLATTDLPEDDRLVEMARCCDVGVFRGSAHDVLARYVGAARASRAQIVVRVCADNPFVAPEEIDRLVAFFREQDCDYACNHQARLGSPYADGFGAEILSAALLDEIAAAATESRHREHVTLYLWEARHDYRVRSVPAPVELSYPALKFDVDDRESLMKLDRLVRAGVGIETSAARIVELARLTGSTAECSD